MPNLSTQNRSFGVRQKQLLAIRKSLDQPGRSRRQSLPHTERCTPANIDSALRCSRSALATSGSLHWGTDRRVQPRVSHLPSRRELEFRRARVYTQRSDLVQKKRLFPCCRWGLSQQLERYRALEACSLEEGST